MIWLQEHCCVPPCGSSLLGRCSLIHPWVLTEKKAPGCKSELCQELIIPSISEHKHNLNAVLLWEPVCCWPVCPSEDCEHRNVIIIAVKLCSVHKAIFTSLNGSCSLTTFSALVLHPTFTKMSHSPCFFSLQVLDMPYISFYTSCYGKSRSWCFGLFLKLHFTHQ